MFCDLSLASFDAVEDALDGTNVAVTDTAAVSEDFNDADANNTNDDDDGDDDDGEGADIVTDDATDAVDDNDFDEANTNDDNDADADCEINDVVISEAATDEEGVIILDDDSTDVNRGVASGTELPTWGCKIDNTRAQWTKAGSRHFFSTCTGS